MDTVQFYTAYLPGFTFTTTASKPSLANAGHRLWLSVLPAVGPDCRGFYTTESMAVLISLVAPVATSAILVRPIGSKAQQINPTMQTASHWRRRAASTCMLGLGGGGVTRLSSLFLLLLNGLLPNRDDRPSTTYPCVVGQGGRNVSIGCCRELHNVTFCPDRSTVRGCSFHKGIHWTKTISTA